MEPATIVVLGGTGHLMRRKLLPALYRLAGSGRLAPGTRILGAARSRQMDDAAFQAWAAEALAEAGLFAEEQTPRWCRGCLAYQSVGGGTADEFRALGSRIEALERAKDQPANRVFYLALPPEAFPPSIAGLGAAGLNRSAGWTRLVIEKPFGRDLSSAQALNRLVHQHFDESQVYRIDHYLGKETVQNLLVFRFANPVFETLWNRDRVASVQITVAEQVGVEGRAGYYETAGALRDIVQNHLTQVLALVAMEVPGAFEADQIRNEKVKVLRVIPPVGADDVVCGQYTAGRIDGRAVLGYRQEPGVAPDSTTETFAALRLRVENWRWHGVPFYLRTGKRLPRRLTQVIVTFRRPPVSLFSSMRDPSAIRPNVLAIAIQPDEGFELGFQVKAPGQPIALEMQRLRFRYAEAFAPLADAYETLLLDVLQGDQTLFVRADEAEAAWALYAPVVDRGAPERPPVYVYPAGTWGPAEAARLLADGEQWLPS
ncbi:MAG: glucose-6-phosphate dehydrogenase [Armatimonadota bacterium]|nr:glucose-6-phosphate dehydrogenase [Armatimonadota bacterium]